MVTLDVKKAGDGTICIPGLLEVPCERFEQVIELLREGNTNRSVAATNMNSASSRSHMYAARAGRRRSTRSISLDIVLELQTWRLVLIDGFDFMTWLGCWL